MKIGKMKTGRFHWTEVLDPLFLIRHWKAAPVSATLGYIGTYTVGKWVAGKLSEQPIGKVEEMNSKQRVEEVNSQLRECNAQLQKETEVNRQLMEEYMQLQKALEMITPLKVDAQGNTN
ncbi:hypothetical protein ACHQM5_009912 [Ranunculus cassubicifolius]